MVILQKKSPKIKTIFSLRKYIAEYRCTFASEIRNKGKILILTNKNWGLGQTAKMSACHAVRSGFNSRKPRNENGL